MKTISLSDIIFARATMMGREVANIRLHGISSMDDLVHRLRAELGSALGMVIVSIRNLSQGWTQERALILR